MRLTTKKIEEILISILGEDGLPLIKQLTGRSNVSEFDLANKTKKDIKIIRKMLYLLYNHNLVGFTRKKDKQKGWYIYYWTLLPDSIRFSYFKMKRELLERLRSQLALENKELFFVCANDCVRLDFDQSINFEFHCPECGELIAQDDSRDRVTKLKNKINELEGELGGLKQERTVRRKIVKKQKKQIKSHKKAARKTKGPLGKKSTATKHTLKK